MIFKDFLQPLRPRRITSHTSEDAKGNHRVFTVWMILVINFSFVKYEIRRENCNRS